MIPHSLLMFFRRWTRGVRIVLTSALLYLSWHRSLLLGSQSVLVPAYGVLATRYRYIELGA